MQAINILLTGLFLLSCAISDAQWTAQQAQLNPSLRFVDMNGPDDVFTSGAAMKVFHRSSIGTQWGLVPINTDLGPFFNFDVINGIQRINDSVIVAVLESTFELQEFVLRTSNNGVSWNAVHIGPDYSGLLDLIYVAGDRCLAVGKSGRILEGSNQGTSWVLQPSTTQATLYDIDMWDNTLGYVVGNGVVLRTTNGGSNWIEVYSGPERFQHVSAFGGDTLYATAFNGPDEFASLIFMRSDDGGSNWEEIFTPFDSYIGIKATSANTVYLAGETGLYRSTTAGNTWHTFPEIAGQQLLGAIDFSDEQNGVAVGQYGAIVETDNGGGSGVPMASFQPDTTIVCVDEPLSLSNYSPTGMIYEWSYAGVPFANTYDASITFTESGYKTITLEVSDGTSQTIYTRTVLVNSPPIVDGFDINLNGGPVCEGASRTVRSVHSTGGDEFRMRVNGTWVTNWSTIIPINYLITDVQQDMPIEVQTRVQGFCGPSYATEYDTLRMVPDALPITSAVQSYAICTDDTAYVVLDQMQSNYTYLATWSNVFNTVVGTTYYSDTVGPVVDDHRFYGSDSLSRSFMVVAILEGCTTTVVEPVFVNSYPVSAEFEAIPTQAILGLPIQFQNTSIGTSYEWTFPASAQPQTTNLAEPQVTFQQTGFEEIISLTVTNIAGCTARDTLNIEVMVPIETISPEECLEQEIGEPMVWVIPEGYSMGLGYYYSPLDMVTDVLGNSIVTGCYRTQQGDYYGDALFITKYDRSGGVLFDLRVPQQSSNHSSTGIALDVDASGNILLAGLAGAFNNGWQFSFLGMNFGYSAQSAGFIIKLDSTGQALWHINVTGGDSFEGVTDVLFLPDGSAIFAMNGSNDEREITFANGETLSTDQIAPPFGVRNLFLVKVNALGELIAVLPGSAPVGLGSSWSFGPVFSPIATFTNSTGYSPLAPRLSLSCNGSIQVWTTQNGQHDLDGTLFGEPNNYYQALSSTDFDLNYWQSHHLFAQHTCTEGRDILSRPILLSGTMQNTTLLSISDRQMNTPVCDTTQILSNGSLIDAHGQSAIVLINHITGEILWDRKLGGVGIKELLRIGDDRFVVYGQALDHASVMIDGEVMGQNNLQLRDIVLFEFDFDGQFHGMTSFGSPEQDIACEATSNGCGEITMLASINNEAIILRRSMVGTCLADICSELHLTTCNDTLSLCAPQSFTLNWQTSGTLGPLTITHTSDQIPDSAILAENVDASLGQYFWIPDPSLFNGQNITLHVSDENGTILDEVTVQMIPSLDVGLTTDGSMVCSGDSIALNTNSGFASYAWSNGDSSVVQTYALTTGNYEVTVSDQFGCQASESLYVTVLSSALFTENDTTICGVAEGTLSVSTGYDDYAWSTGYTGPLATQPISISGPVLVLATSDLGCQASDTIEVNFIPPLAISITEQAVYCFGQDLTLDIVPNVPVTYLWFSGSTAPTHPLLTSTNSYSVTVTDDGGCTYTISEWIEPTFCVGIDEEFDSSRLIIQPNPASQQILIIHSDLVELITVFDALGNLLINEKILIGSSSTNMDISEFQCGAYILELVRSDGSRLRSVFVKQ